MAARNVRRAVSKLERATRGVRPTDIVEFVLAAFGVLLVLNLLAIYVIQEQLRGRRIARMFYFDEEANFSTLFNYLLWIGVAALTALQTARGGRWRHYWAVLVVVFLLLAFDEAARMHELINPLVGRYVEVFGYPTFAWQIPGLAFVVVIGVLYLRLLLALPRRISVLILVGGGMFVAGALGMELIGAKFWSEQAQNTPAYGLVATLEETLEILGLVVVGYALMRLLADEDGRLRLEALAPGPPAAGNGDSAGDDGR